MKKKLTLLAFSLLLAVGWTSNASAQKLPDKSLADQYIVAVEKAQKEYLPVFESTEDAAHSHVATPVKMAKKSTSSSRQNAPMRTGQDLKMKSLTKAEADALTYTWTDAEGTHTSKASDVARKPEQMYELLKYVYTCKDFPGPYYSAFTKDDQRERQVYYGAVDGGWEITGPTLSSTTATFLRPTSNSSGSSTNVANGTATSNNIPVSGNYQDYGYRSQMIYPGSLLGDISEGDKITSITFHPTNGIRFSGSTVTFRLSNTSETNFGTSSNNSVSRKSIRGAVIATVTPSTNTTATTWTITFNKPLTYAGGNLLLDVYCVGTNHDSSEGSYSSQSSMYGANQTNYQSMYVHGTSTETPATDATGTNSQFLPYATFGYTKTTYQEVAYNPAIQIGDITISGNNDYAMIYSITIKSGSTTVFSWDYTDDGTATSTSAGSWPTGMTLDYWGVWSSGAIGFSEDENNNRVPITLDDWLFMGYSNLTVTINARSNSSSNYASLIVNGDEKTFNSRTRTDYVWENINGTTYPYTKYDPDYYKPNQEGYTALVVAVKNQTSHGSTSSTYDGSYFTTKQEIIDYFANNIDSIQLLTEGLRIGDASDYSIGTVFNHSGTFNKFFYLGKGQAKQKTDVVINREIAMQHALGELAPFKCMFEQFSPTSGDQGAEIENFYSLMNEGNVYNVVHDCRDVIWLGHQFSMSGNTGEKAYAMTSMNFFIPDYRLKFWEDYFTTGRRTYTIDGRITNPYQIVSADGNPKFNPSLVFRSATNYSFFYAWYNQDYAPKVGLYKITLDAVATPVAYDYNEGNRNYAVTLTWVSSLNEMTGHDVEQIYTVYYWDPETGEKKYVQAVGITNGKTGLTTVTYLVEQKKHSYKIEYIVEGTPNDGNEHPQFVAISNIDDVVIPGWDDFVGLELDHHESDFVVGDMANMYRNFLVIVNEDVANGLTIDQITDANQPMNEFKLYRFEYGENDEHVNEKPIATVKFKNPTNQQVEYEVIYDDVNKQEQYKPQDDEHKYDLDSEHLDVPLTGVVRIKGNGDIVIWPNGFHVNFKSIVIKNDGVAIPGYSWNADEDNDLPEGWYISSGSKWEEYINTTNDDKVGYVEGGGYIYIPNMMNNSNYTNLTVEIVAYGDGSNVSRISVNDLIKTIANTTGATYIWGSEIPLSPAAAPMRDRDNNTTNN